MHLLLGLLYADHKFVRRRRANSKLADLEAQNHQPNPKLTAMLSVASLLNPVKPEPRGTQLPSSPPSSLYTSSSTHGSPQLSTQSLIKKQKMTKDGAVFAKGKIKGDVRYPPFEKLDEESMREVQRFQVYPLGKIEEYCRHIPYNSEKKSFLEKTGRESFEGTMTPFNEEAQDPLANSDCSIPVHIQCPRRRQGLHRDVGLQHRARSHHTFLQMLQIFKGKSCLLEIKDHAKIIQTTPAKMLNMNPGLKEITHSITGGALAAQGMKFNLQQALLFLTQHCRILDAILLRPRSLYDLLRTHSRCADPNFRSNISLPLRSTRSPRTRPLDH